MSTIVIYNGVTLRNVLTEEFSFTPVNDNSSTDKLFDRYVIAVECIVALRPYQQALAGTHLPLGLEIAGGPTCFSAQDVFDIAKPLLATHRCDFQYIMEGTVVLEAWASTAAHNTPHVIKCEMTSISSALIRIRWSVEIKMPPCTDGGNNPFWPVINNRWSVIDDIDETFRTRRTWSGRLVLAKSPAALDAPLLRTAHLYRHLCVPPLNPGWRRTAMKFTGEANGVELGYEVVDEELACEGPPYPAVTMQFTHEKAFNPYTSPKQVETIGVILRGPAKVDRRLLVWRAAQILVARGRISTDTVTKNRMLRAVRIVEQTNESGCVVSADARIHNIGGDEEASGKFAAMDIYPLGEVLTLPAPGPGQAAYDPTRPYATGPWGSGMGLLISTLSAAWQTSCTGDHANTQGTIYPAEPPAQGQPTSDSPPQITWQQVAPPNKQGPDVNDSARAAIYEHCRLESKLVWNFGKVQLPFAAPVVSGGRTKTCKIIQASAPSVQRVVTIQAERVGDEPIRFKPKNFEDANGATYEVQEFWMSDRAPEVMQDGTLLYSTDAHYLFLLDEEPDLTKPLPIGVLFWDTRNAMENNISPNSWRDPDSGSQGLN